MTSDNDRLRAVFLKRSKISQREFGERYGIGTAGMVNQLLGPSAGEPRRGGEVCRRAWLRD